MRKTERIGDKYTDVEVPVKMRVHPDGMYLRMAAASGELPDGTKFEVSTNVAGGSPIIQFDAKEKGHWTCYVFGVKDLVDAVLAYREEEGKAKK